jgi:hypothetical protein
MRGVERQHLAPAGDRSIDLILTEELEALREEASRALSGAFGHGAYSLSCTS